jgi:PDGLE domain
MKRNTVLAIAAVIVVLTIGVVVSQFASSEPDGLEYVAGQQGFDDTAQTHTLEDAPLADYGGNLDQDPAISTAVAAVVGIAVTALLSVGLFWVARSRKHEPTATP